MKPVLRRYLPHFDPHGFFSLFGRDEPTFPIGDGFIVVDNDGFILLVVSDSVEVT